MIAEEPEFPQIMSDAEIDANVPDSEFVDLKDQRPSTDRKLTEEAVALLKTLFPRIHQNLVTMWGTGPGEAYLDGLIMDERGNRQGFPPDVLRALLVLQRVHFQTFGTFKKIDPWDVGLKKTLSGFAADNFNVSQFAPRILAAFATSLGLTQNIAP